MTPEQAIADCSQSGYAPHAVSRCVEEIRRTARDDHEMKTEFCLLLLEWDRPTITN